MLLFERKYFYLIKVLSSVDRKLSLSLFLVPYACSHSEARFTHDCGSKSKRVEAEDSNPEMKFN